MNVRDAQVFAVKALTNSETPTLDSLVILEHILGMTRSALMAHPEVELGKAESFFLAAVKKRAAGLPVAYIIGIREFYGLPFQVTPDVLIPKADTEILVERASEIIKTIQEERSGQNDEYQIRVLDVCTGSGCIAIALKHAYPALDITATDISSKALAIARLNAKTLLANAVSNISGNKGPETDIRFIEGDLRNGLPPVTQESLGPGNEIVMSNNNSFSPLKEDGYDLIVSNPPYVPTKLAQELLEDGRSEPLLALDGGTEGLDLICALIDQARQDLAPKGRLLIETGEYNAAKTGAYLKKAGFTAIVIHRDLANQDRVVEGMRI